MKNKIFLLLIILIATNSIALADKGSSVISDADKQKQKETMDSLNDINQYTNNFFTPHIVKTAKPLTEEELRKKKQEEAYAPPTHGSILPVKKLRIWIKNRKNPKKGGVVEEVSSQEQAILDCDVMEYFAPKTELEANGNVVMVFPQNKSTIKADKMIYNQTSNIVQAFGHVVLINEGKELFGDYMKIDMNEENAFMDNPISNVFQIRARAKTGYMYGDKIIQEQGSLLITKKTPIHVKSEMFGPDLDTMFVDEKHKAYYSKDSHGEKFKIKTNDLIINSKKEHDTVTLKHAEVYFDEKKIGTIPSITMHTNKAQDYVEANFPEIGTLTNMGMYAGPGFVFDTPKGTTVKVVPMLNYQSNGDNSSDNALGWGALVKFKSATNKTDMGYGTANKIFMTRGLQKLDDNLYFQYATNSYMDDWFMGFRMPKLLGELVYQDGTTIENFIGKNKNMTFTNRIAAAYAQAGNYNGPLLDGEGGVGTLRLKYMAEAAQTFYSINNPYTSPINARFDLISQGSAGVYGTGDTQMVARIGPMIHSQYRNWMQDAGYFLSAYNDHTPLVSYDSYMYGRSNVYLRESYRVAKFLTLSWFGSLNLSNDSPDGKMIQENGFYFAIGPDDVKLNIGYDTVRQQSFVTMAFNLDAKGSTIEYKKMVIKNPDTLGKNENGSGNNQTSSLFSPSSSDDDSVGIERAQVIDIKEAL